jgi:hypothetical protein
LSKDSSEDVQVILADIDAVLVDLERANAALAEAQKDTESLREFAQWVASLRTGGMIERKAKEALEGER